MNRPRLTEEEHAHIIARRKGLAGASVTDDDLPFILGMPDGENEVEEPLRIEGKSALVFGDVHLGFHDRQAIESCIGYARKRNIDTVLLNGDILDFYAISRFDKRPNKTFIVHEIKLAREFFGLLRTAFNNAQIYFKQGNHEERYSKYFYANAKELFGIEEFELPNLLHLEKHGIVGVGERQLLSIGKLNIYHGHELFGGGVHVAANIVNKTGANIMVNHHHKTQDYTKTRLNEEPIAGFAVGCLCKLRPFYMPSNQWNHGFATVELNSDGTFVVSNKRIIEGKVI